MTQLNRGQAIRRSGKRRLVERALREKEQGYRLLSDAVRDHAVFVMDPGGHVASWNSGAERVKGYKAEEIIGRHFSCFFPAEDVERGRPEEILQLTAASGRHEEQAMRVRKDGSCFPAGLIFTALRDSAGQLSGFCEFSYDLGENKEVGGKYRGLLEAAPDAMVVVDKVGDIVLLNLQAEKQFGYRRDELVGQQVRCIIPEGFAERLIADDSRTAAEALAQQSGTGIELMGRRKDGSDFPIEIMLSPLESSEGILVTAAIRDISVRKTSEKRLAQMERRYRGLLEAAPDAIVVVDQAGDIVLLNLQAEKQFGYRRDELVGQQVKSIIPEGFAERLIADGTRTAAEALAQQIGTGIELIGRRKDGSDFPIEIMLSPLENPEGILVTAAIRDISERKRTEAALTTANQELESFSYSVAHDLRAPLRGMNGFANILLDDYADKLDAEGKDCLHEIHNNALRMASLIDALLSLARVNRSEMRPVRTSLTSAVRTAASQLAAVDQGRQVEVVVQDGLFADIDPQLCRNLVDNLLGNAWKFTAKVAQARIEFGSAEEDGVRAFFVRDNGAGFDMAHARKLFVPFQRLHTVGEFQGTGIGLATAQRIVKRHGGRIWAKGGVNVGATFYFTLPATVIGETI